MLSQNEKSFSQQFMLLMTLQFKFELPEYSSGHFLHDVFENI